MHRITRGFMALFALSITGPFLYISNATPPPPSISSDNEVSYFESTKKADDVASYGPFLGTVTLGGSNNRLAVSGDYEMGTTTVERLIIASDSVVEFWWEEDPDDPGGMYHPTLFLKNLEIVGNSTLILDGPGGLRIKDNGSDISYYFNHIKARVDGELRNTVWTRAHGFYSIVDYSPWTPVPESATYGGIFGVLGVGLATWRRQRRRPSRAPHFSAQRSVVDNQCCPLAFPRFPHTHPHHL